MIKSFSDVVQQQGGLCRSFLRRRLLTATSLELCHHLRSK